MWLIFEPENKREPTHFPFSIPHFNHLKIPGNRLLIRTCTDNNTEYCNASTSLECWDDHPSLMTFSVILRDISVFKIISSNPALMRSIAFAKIWGRDIWISSSCNAFKINKIPCKCPLDDSPNCCKRALTWENLTSWDVSISFLIELGLTEYSELTSLSSSVLLSCRPSTSLLLVVSTLGIILKARWN